MVRWVASGEGFSTWADGQTGQLLCQDVARSSVILELGKGERIELSLG